MNDRTDENLQELFEGFLERQQAEQAARDVSEGEQSLRDNPAAEPGGKAIADIKAEIGRALLRRKSVAFRTMLYKAGAAVAAVIILAGLGARLFDNGGGVSGMNGTASMVIIPEVIWESEDIADSDESLAALTAEIEQIQEDVLALQLNEDTSNGASNITELEMELIAINSDFWKG